MFTSGAQSNYASSAATTPSQIQSTSYRHAQLLREFNEDIFKKNFLTDVEAIAEGKVFKTHRAVLACFSQYLRKKLLTDDGKPMTNKVHIPKVRASEFNILLHYMYTGDLKVSCNNYFEIYEAASILEMKEVMQDCLQLLEARDEIKTYFLIYVTAKKMGIQSHWSRALKLLTHRLEETVCANEFLQLDFFSVVEILSAQNIGARSEVIVFIAALNWLNYDYKARRQYAVKVMECVRFSSMTMDEVVACYHPPFLPEVLRIPEIVNFLHRATCYITAKYLGQESWFKEYGWPKRNLAFENLPMELWHQNRSYKRTRDMAVHFANSKIPSKFSSSMGFGKLPETGYSLDRMILQQSHRFHADRGGTAPSDFYAAERDGEVNFSYLDNPQRDTEGENSPTITVEDEKTVTHQTQKVSHHNKPNNSNASATEFVNRNRHGNKAQESSFIEEKSYNEACQFPALDSYLNLRSSKQSLIPKTKDPIKPPESHSHARVNIQEIHSRHLLKGPEEQSRSYHVYRYTEKPERADVSFRQEDETREFIHDYNVSNPIGSSDRRHVSVNDNAQNEPSPQKERAFRAAANKVTKYLKDNCDDSLMRRPRALSPGNESQDRAFTESQTQTEKVEMEDIASETDMLGKSSASSLVSSEKSPANKKLQKACILVIGGLNPKNLLSLGIGGAVLNFDPDKKKWLRYSSLPEARHNHCAAFCNNCLYVIGGCDPNDTLHQNRYVATRTCFRLDIGTQEWTELQDMKFKRYDHGVALLAGHIYVIGGQDEGDRLLKSLEVYDTKRNRWKLLTAEMCCGRKAMGATAFSSRIWIAGGLVQPDQEISLQLVSHVDCYDPKQKRWLFSVSSLPSPRCYSALTVWNKRIYCIGGMLQKEKQEIFPTDEVWFYNDEDKMWTQGQSIPIPRVGNVAIVYDKCLYVMGGFDPDADLAIRNVNYIKSDSSPWEIAAPLPSHLFGLAAVSTNDTG